MPRRMLECPGLGDEGFLGAGQPGEVIQHRQPRIAPARRLVHREFHLAVGGVGVVLVIPQHAAVCGMPGYEIDAGSHQVLSVPFCLATCVAIASISTGDNASYGGNRSFFSRSRTFFMSLGRTAPASMIDETKAANSGLFQPLSFDSSTCTKSRPKNGCPVFSMRPYM